MADLTISLPDETIAWIEEQVRLGVYATANDLVRNALRRDRERLEPGYPLTDAELQDMLDEAEASGVSNKSLEDVFEEAMQLVARRNRVA